MLGFGYLLQTNAGADMSQTANWSYTNKATVKPRTGNIDKYGDPEYGTEYEIACTWGANAKQAAANAGREFLVKNTIYTEDPRPQYLDMIKLNGSDQWEEIRERQAFDMSFFGEVPDYFLITG